MARADLTGKTVMIAEGKSDKLLADLAKELEGQGAKVVVSQHSATHPDNVQLIADEIAAHQPKIDALVLHDTDTDRKESQITAIALTKKFKGELPVVVHDWHSHLLPIQAIESAGAKYVDFGDEPNKVAFAVADAIAEQAKSGRVPAGK